MARPRDKKSKLSFAGLGLKPEEDDQLKVLLKEQDLSVRQLVRALVRQWMVEGGHGVLKYSKK